MADVVLFHHALGLTPGVTAFADEHVRRFYVAVYDALLVCFSERLGNC